MKLLILGPPGSGKGTMAHLVSEQHDIVHISTGNLFRDNIKLQTKLGMEVEEIVKSGGLVPDELTMSMLKQRLEKEDAQKGFILDGYPRTIKQAQLLDGYLQIDKAVFLVVSKKTIIERISFRRVCTKCGMVFNLKNIPPKQEGICDVCKNPLIQREDETEEVVKHRIEVYNKETLPVVEYYREKGLVVDIDAEPAPDVIFHSILAGIPF